MNFNLQSSEPSQPITLKNEDLIRLYLEELCENALEDYFLETKNTRLATDYTINGKKIYRSYDIQPQDNPNLTNLLQNQGIEPFNYLVSVILGESDRSFKPHIDKQRHYSIMFIYKDSGAITQFFKEIKPKSSFFYNEDDVELTHSYELTEGNFYTFNHQIPHGVVNIGPDVRCHVTITLSTVN